MYNSGILKFREINSQSNGAIGSLTPIEAPGEIPFEVKRLYYIYNVKDDSIRENIHIRNCIKF